MQRMTKLATALGALAIVVAACGGGAHRRRRAGNRAPATAPGRARPRPRPPTRRATIKLTLWTKEGEADGSLQYVKKLAAAYTALHPNVTFEVVNKDVEALREDFQTASLAGNPPEILWTVADHVGPFTAADLILPLDDIVDKASYVPAAADIVTGGRQALGRADLLRQPADALLEQGPRGRHRSGRQRRLVAKAKELTTGDNYGIVFNQTESFWLVPVPGRLQRQRLRRGRRHADPGHGRHEERPPVPLRPQVHRQDHADRGRLQRRRRPVQGRQGRHDHQRRLGRSAAYAEAFGDKLGVGPIPQLTGGDCPKPYIAGAFFMVPKAVGDNADLKCVVVRLHQVVDEHGRTRSTMVKTLKRLPGNATAIADPIVTGDPLLAGAAAAAKKGVPQPTNLEMRCVFDSMTAGVRDMFTGNSDIAGIAGDDADLRRDLHLAAVAS